MSDGHNNEADLVFKELEAVANATRRLRKSGAWNSDSQRLHQAYQDVASALAEAAYSDFANDPRRWDAGAILLRQVQAFWDVKSGSPSPWWQARTAEVEAAILAAPDAPNAALGVVFSLALTRLEAGEEAAGYLEDLESLISKIEARSATPSLLYRAYALLIGKLEQRDDRGALGARLQALSTHGDTKLRSFTQGRRAVLAGRETPLKLSLEVLSGGALNVADLRGEVVLLQYWASWCGPCRAEIPHLREAYAAYRERGFRIVGLSLDVVNEGEGLEEARSRVATFMRDNDMGWPTQFNGLGWNNPVVDQFGVLTIPASILLDRQGRVAALNLRGDKLGAKVERLLAE